MNRGIGRQRRTTLILVVLLSFLTGLAVAKVDYKTPLWLVIFGGLLIWISLHHKVLLLPGLMLIGLTVGWWRGSVIATRLHNYDQLMANKVVLVGRAETDATYDNRSQLSFDLSNIQVEQPISQNLVGKIGVSGFGLPMVYRGDVAQVTGRLFPSRGSRQASIRFAELRVVSRHYSWLDTTRLKFLAGMQSALPEPLASFGLGLLIGQRNTLPNGVSNQLAAVGLTHIIAVSGYNLTILVQAMRRLGGRRSKYQTAVLSLSLMGLFVLFTGFTASIVRAALVSGLSLGAWYYGRQIRPLLIILLTAGLTAGWNPLYLWSDVGWWLSFLAFYGVLMIAPLLTQRFFTRQPNALSSVLIESLSAIIMTAPLIMLVFGQISLVAIMANAIVVPFVPLAMLLSLISGLSGMWLPALAGWFGWPARLLLTFMLDAVQVLSKIPHALSKSTMTYTELILSYVVITLLTLLLWHKTRPKSGIITDVESV